MKKTTLTLLTVGLVFLATARSVHSHCEIPCGIYGDTMRISMLYENIATVEKSMTSINELSTEAHPNWNQLVRWTVNKEEHANNIQHIVTQYFMTQRVKPDHKSYVKLLTTLHGMLLAALKAKQTTDVASVADLRRLVGELSAAYFNEADLKHIKEHHPEGK